MATNKSTKKELIEKTNWFYYFLYKYPDYNDDTKWAIEGSDNKFYVAPYYDYWESGLIVLKQQ